MNPHPNEEIVCVGGPKHGKIIKYSGYNSYEFYIAEVDRSVHWTQQHMPMFRKGRYSFQFLSTADGIRTVAAWEGWCK